MNNFIEELDSNIAFEEQRTTDKSYGLKIIQTDILQD